MPIMELETGLVVEDIDSMDLSKLDEDTQIDVMLIQLDTLAEAMEQRGISLEVIDAALFSAFVGRLQERGDRPSFDGYVQEATEDDWPSFTLH